MSTQQLQSEAIKLPLQERVSLAQALWESINKDLSEINEAGVLQAPVRRRQRDGFGHSCRSVARRSNARRAARNWMRLIYHPVAEIELIEAARFHEQRVVSLGADFLDHVDTAILRIQEAPTRWKILEGEVRRYLMPRFPFAIYYRVLPDHIGVLAFARHSFHPDYWRYLLQEG